jgi:thioredoxin 1
MTTDDFTKEISTGKTLVDFYASWCGPCKLLAPRIKEAQEELTALNVKVLKVDIDDSDELSNKVRISVVPTVILYEDGEMKAKFVGVKDKDSLLKFVKENL